MKQTTLGACSGALLALLASPVTALAHHGIGAQFNLSTSIELQGELERVTWRNPHVRLTVRVPDDAGGEEIWEVEAQSVSMLRQRDITEVLLEVGDTIALAGNPARGGATEIYLTNVLLPDGREVLFSQNAEPRWNGDAMGRTGPRFVSEGDASAPEFGLFRAWSPTLGPRIFSDISSNNPVLAEQARLAAEAYDPMTDNLATGECTPKGMPGIVGNPYPRDFVDQGETILLRFEEYDTVRTIHMGDVAPGMASILGHSVGEWADGTLVVTTTNFSAGTFRLGIQLSEELKILERFTPSADGSRLQYRLTLTDPAAFVEPIELESHWIYIPGLTVEPYRCLEG